LAEISLIRDWILEEEMGWKYAIQEMNELKQEAYEEASNFNKL